MSAPIFNGLSAPANLIASIGLSASQHVAVLLDISSGVVESELKFVDVVTTAPSAVSGVQVQAFLCVEAGTTTTGTSSANGVGVGQGGNTVTVASAVGMSVGAKILFGNEVVTIAGIAGNTLTISATQRAQAVGSAVYLFAHSVAYANAPTMGQNQVTANTTYAVPLTLQSNTYIIVMTNLDGGVGCTVWATRRDMTNY